MPSHPITAKYPVGRTARITVNTVRDDSTNPNTMTANQIEERAKKAHVKIKDLLARSGVARSTWWRWTTGKFQPSSGTVETLIATLKKIEHSK